MMMLMKRTTFVDNTLCSDVWIYCFREKKSGSCCPCENAVGMKAKSHPYRYDWILEVSNSTDSANEPASHVSSS